jgi:hypothetical protein
MILAQAADSGGIDLAQILGIGGPSSIATALVFWLGKLWLESRREKREDTKTERESESGIVETTSALTKLVRDQMLEMAAQIKSLQTDNNDLRADIARMRAEHSMEVEKLRERITGLEIDNEQLRRARGLG